MPGSNINRNCWIFTGKIITDIAKRVPVIRDKIATEMAVSDFIEIKY